MEAFGDESRDREPLLRDVERFVILQIVDRRWREHLENMDYLREGSTCARWRRRIRLSSTGPKARDVRGARARHPRGGRALRSSTRSSTPSRARSSRKRAAAAGGNGGLSYEHESLAGAEAIAAAGGAAGALAASATPVGGGGGAVATRQRVGGGAEKLGRNDPCWCGCGKKFKKCHGA